MDFKKEYKKLNKKQQQAVNHIDGPLIVIAGPGSGKTELLSMRVASILQKTDVPPSTILCLTFTNAGSVNIKERLVSLIGEDAYKVPVFTFHSFCLDIIERYPEFFSKGVGFNLADQAVKMEVLEDILNNLEFDDPLKKHHPRGGYVYLKDVEKSIFYLQDGGVTPTEFKEILVQNKKEGRKIDQIIKETLGERIKKETLFNLNKVLQGESIKKLKKNRFNSLSKAVFKSLENAVSSGETSVLSEWKRKMTGKLKGKTVLKETLQIEKMESLASIYEEYREEMHKRGYYTFSDMILDVVQVLKENEDLRSELQENYLYIQVDEFQDTSGVQMRLLDFLSLEQIDEKPNICVVGDDDQAIYRFQGADISNVIDFKERYFNTETVVLLKNYRSRKEIVDFSRKIILKAEERLESRYLEVNKKLVSEKKGEGVVSGVAFNTKEEEFSYVARKVKEIIKKKENNPEEVAVIARTHSEIKEILFYFNALNIPTVAERKENVLEKDSIKEIITILKFSAYLLDKKDKIAEELLPEILSFSFLEVKREKIWEIAEKSYREKTSWINLILKDKELRKKGLFLLELGMLAKTQPVEEVIDVIIGNKEVFLSDGKEKKKFLSKFKDFYFKKKIKEKKEGEYLSFLSSLRCFINAIKKHREKDFIGVEEAVNLLSFYENNGIPILDKSPLVSAENAVSVITAHGAKGREFETVFVLSCHQTAWGREKRGKMLSFPLNLPLEKAGSKKDDQVRLFYVAVTRAKKNLYLTTHKFKTDGREVMKLEFMGDLKIKEEKEKINEEAVSFSFGNRDVIPFRKKERELLFPLVENYKLSATGFNKFLNVNSGGPEDFFEESLLRFPKRKTKTLSYGTAVHNTVKETYLILKKEGKLLSEKDFFLVFKEFLKEERLSEKEFQEMISRGKKELSSFYKKKACEFSPDHIIEKNFFHENCVVDEVGITGKIDKIILEENKARVFDYKTGAPLTTWKEKDENKKIKAWQYKNQLIFYKLLIENSREFSKYEVSEGFLEFIALNKEKEIITLPLEIENEDAEKVKNLIARVGEKIKNLDFPSTEKYKKNSLKSINQFENDLLEGKI